MFQWIFHEPERVPGSHLVRLVWKDQAVILKSPSSILIPSNSARENPNPSANPHHLDLLPVFPGTHFFLAHCQRWHFCCCCFSCGMSLSESMSFRSVQESDGTFSRHAVVLLPPLDGWNEHRNVGNWTRDFHHHNFRKLWSITISGNCDLSCSISEIEMFL